MNIIKQIEDALVHATEGPWEISPYTNKLVDIYSAAFAVANDLHQPDADLIVLLRNAAPQILAALRLAEQAMDKRVWDSSKWWVDALDAYRRARDA